MDILYIVLIHLFKYQAIKMQAEIHSHAFQLQQDCISTSLVSHPKELIFYASAYRKQQDLSYLYALKYSEENPRKSILCAQKTNGKINSLYTFTNAQNSVQEQQSGYSMMMSVSNANDNKCKILYGNCSREIQGTTTGFNKTDVNQLTGFQQIHQQNSKIHNFICKPSTKSSIFFNTDSSIYEYDLSKKNEPSKIREVDENTKIKHLKMDPIHQFLSYTTTQNNNIHILDKSLKNSKYQLQLSTSNQQPILNIDYNRNKQYYMMSTHYSSVKFWDIRRPNMPIKLLLNDQIKHSLFLNSVYNYSHDELVISGFDDGTLGLYRMTSVSSVPNKNEQDVCVRLYDEHEDSVYHLTWSEYSPWLFASYAYGASNIVVNLVPNVEKYRILL